MYGGVKVGVLVLPQEVSDVTARLIVTDKKYANYINNICEMKDIEYTNDLFLKIGGKSLDFGGIEHVETYYKSGKEYWEITTTKAYFKFQVLNKPKSVVIPVGDKRGTVDELKCKRLLKEVNQMFDSFFNKECDFSKMTPPWKI